MPFLTRDEATARAALLSVTAMTVDLDLDSGTEEFGSTTTIEFTATEPGARTFVDLKPVSVRRITLNGRAIPVDSLEDGRVPLHDLSAVNTLQVEARMAYSRDGQGLHRATDPADGEDYVYGHLFLDAGPTVFACFDQPDLKAPYAVTVTAPPDWTVLGNGVATLENPGRWRLATTLPLASYFVTVCAGPYASVLDEHDGIPLGVHARASMREQLEAQAPEIFQITRESFDNYHRLFGIRYPFGAYHQVFVPEFNAGAMENPGCVVLRDQYIFRGVSTRDQHVTRANTISHEMAHQWFGDLVTMRWWDDLWLNESFAEYMAYRTLVEATEFSEAWVECTVVRKAWGYAAERSPSTHPVAGSPAETAQAALQNFDGIAYAKGTAVLRQLIAHIGDDAFLAGTSAYLRQYSYGNGTFADFLGALEAAHGHSLAAWSAAWLQTPGVDRIAVDPATGLLTRVAPAEHPADRPHTLDLAGYEDGREVWRVATTIDATSTVVDGVAPATIVVPNAGDLTWATVEFDPTTLANLPEHLAAVPDVQARAVVWMGLADGVCLGTIDPRHLLRVFAAAWPLETDSAILARVAVTVTARIIPTFLPADERPAATAAVAEAARSLFSCSVAGSSQAIVAARVLATTTVDDDVLQAWASGDGVPEGLAGDDDFRWVVVGRLAELGIIGDAEIDAYLAADSTLTGALAALTARAEQPSPAAKAWAWSELTTNRDRSNYELNALAAGFWRARDPLVVEPYAARYFTEVPAIGGWLGEDALARVAVLAYPARVLDPEVLERSDDLLRSDDLSPAVRRAVIDQSSELRESLRSLKRFTP
ncbi:MAG: aminopeptidase N [Nostocoides sp.]